MKAAAFLSLLFYTVPVVWLFAVWQTQRAVNELAAQGDYVPPVQGAADVPVRVAAEDTSSPQEQDLLEVESQRATSARS